ncbi:heparinase II/III domain-containing protein [Pedobacter africanus]|uniref:Heparinase II/III-like protein n=1 Tax=Pedobacter africanus TaxID=151894 RepID=A0A1W1Z8N5_9SPHI|nr:heparinase II/III family protein [Pedobacter africanus]SMC44736.1 Heparinase II/III-like protein [Pedobacter africanus]
MNNIMQLRKGFVGIIAALFWSLFTGNVTYAQIVQRNFLDKVYRMKGGAASLDVSSWKALRKINIDRNLASVPDAVKAHILSTAHKVLETPWEVAKATDYLLFNTAGNRSIYETLYFTRRKKLNRLVIAELIDGRGRYLPEIVNGLWLILEESSWALPAHMYLQKEGAGLPDPNEDVIDLFAGETSMLLSWIKFLMKPKLNEISPILIKRIDYELNRRILIPYLQRNDFWWMGFQDPKRKMNNWNIWINTNILLTALLAIEDPVKRQQVIDKNINSADKFINSYPADGGCDEGPGYWGAAGGRLIEYVNLLTEVSKNRLNWSNNELMHNITAYIYKAHIADRWFVNFADAPANLVPDPAIVFTGGLIFKDEKLQQFAAYLFQLSNSDEQGFGLDQLNVFLNNISLHNYLKGIPARAPMVQNNWLPNLEVLFTREMPGSKNGLFMAAKAGNNGESHNHNDVGSFIIYLNGLPALVDLGAARYTRETFTPERYKLWVYNSDWHNCPSINGSVQSPGTSFSARNVSFTGNRHRNTLAMDLAPAYPKAAAVNKWIRKLEFNSSDSSIDLTEEYELKEYRVPFELNFVTAVPARLMSPGLLTLVLADSGALHIKFDPQIFEAVVKKQPNTDPGLVIWGKTIYHLSLRSKKNALKAKHSIRFYR